MGLCRIGSISLSANRETCGLGLGLALVKVMGNIHGAVENPNDQDITRNHTKKDHIPAKGTTSQTRFDV
jgi:hypothetical protein